MTPTLMPGDYVFMTTVNPAVIASLSPQAISTFKENEGLSMIVPVELAEGLEAGEGQPMRCITLCVYSSLEGIGLTAAVSKALSDAAIPCNMVAAFHHDHVFVPSAMCEKALEVLAGLQSRAKEGLL
ncbi:MAG: ACT domain-containing protein [Paracoccaceae bacterium]